MLYRKILLAFALLFFTGFSFAVTVHGTIYDAMTLEPLPKAIVEVNSIPAQKIVSKDGTYSFDIPKGNYSVHAVFFEENFKLVADENIEVAESGDFVLDLLLFPDFEQDQNETIEVPVGLEKPEQKPVFEFDSIHLLLISLILFIAVYFAVKKFSRKKSHMEKAHIAGKEKPAEPIKEEPKPQFSPDAELDKYAMEVLDILKRSGNRLTQKELREKISSVGEAKISLIVSELEEMGKVKKIKKGRGNIIVLKQ